MPLIAVIVSGKVPTGVLWVVVTDNVEDCAEALVMFIEAGLKLAFAPVGNPLTLKETFPVNPFEGVTVTL
jgi:hypothetical protein